MKNDKFKRLSITIIIFIGTIASLFIFVKCYPINENIEYKRSLFSSKMASLIPNINTTNEKHKGAHVFGHLDSINLQAILKNNYNWITLVSYGDQKDFDSPTMTYSHGDSLKIIRRDSMWKNRIDIAHSQGFKVFLKPHLWLYEPSKGKWRSDIYPSNEDNWKLWQKNYRAYILLHAKIAEKNNVELFCIGTELSRLSVEKSEFWSNLIRDVRNIYSGKLTYAANWYNEYEKITFWDELDYIGVQAYFPLAPNKYPTVNQIAKGWNKYFPDLNEIHKKYNRKILFTELGYKSTPDSAIKPWEWIEYTNEYEQAESYETQANCYEAFFNTVWDKEWFAGVHIWQLRSDYRKDARFNNVDFTPQGKPAEIVIAKGFVN